VQQQLATHVIGNATANYITTHNEMQAFGEQNDFGIMGSLGERDKRYLAENFVAFFNACCDTIARSGAR